MSFISRLFGIDALIDKKLADRGLGGSVLDPLSYDRAYEYKANEVLFKGDTDEIIRFFKENYPQNQKVTTNLFWRVCTPKGGLPIQHFPLAQQITKAKVSLIFNEAPTFEFEDEDAGKAWDEIAGENDFPVLLRRSAEMRSYSGDVVIVPTRDPSFSDNVILRAFPKERCHVERKYDKPYSATVYERFQKGEDFYILQTEYSNGSIRNELVDKNGRKVPLDRIEETKSLKDEETFSTKMKLFVEVPNNLNGKSDYFGIIDDFSALDEAYSALTDLIRKGHIKTYMPKAKIVQDDKGKTSYPSDYTENVGFIPMANPTNAPYKIERDVVGLSENVTALTTAFNETLSHALFTTGLSPATLGLDGAGADASGEALNIRERQSMRTRAEAIRAWAPALERLVRLALYMQTGKEYEKDISVSFSEYESPTFDQKVDSLSKAKDAGLIDLESALRQLYPDKSDDEIEEMMILIEGGLPKSADDIMDEEEGRLAEDGEEEKTAKEEEPASPDDNEEPEGVAEK